MSYEEHEHTRSNYQSGKYPGCEGCRKANAKYKRDTVAANKERTASETVAFYNAGGSGPLPSLQHGKAFTYHWYGCRCDKCTKEAREKWRQYWRTSVVVKMLKERDKEAV